MNWFRKNLSTVLLIVALIIGLCLLAYPTFSDWWNSFHQSRAIASYAESVAKIDNNRYESMLAEAKAYNARLLEKEQIWDLTPEEEQEYRSILDVSGTGIMCYINIPKINCSLPIYHGTDEGVLQIAVGHIPDSSFPVGGEGTHSVLSGHRGLPSAKLFTDLDRMVVGDTFLINVLDDVLTYEVDQILIVEPYDMSAVCVEPGKDYCTLVTCTPYGINSHRLLVRGHRVETHLEKGKVRVTADAIQIDPMVVAPIVAAPILLILLLVILFRPKRRR